MKRILVVDDERQITRMLRMALQSNGYTVETATNGLEGLQKFQSQRPDLVITDLAMPGMDGLQLTKAIRQSAQTPIIVLSVRAADAMKVEALDAGADDYLTKPFSMQELQARIRALLRRIVAEVEVSETLAEADLVMNTAAHTVTLRGQEVHLTPKEFDLLHIFLRNGGCVLTHKFLLRAVWGSAGDNQPEYLRVLVGQLRKKLDRGSDVRYIHSEPWVGYRFEARPGVADA